MLKEFWTKLVDLMLGTVEELLRAAADSLKALKDRLVG